MPSSLGANDVTNILSAFRPNRAYRRANNGARCSMCGLGIVAVDLALVELEVGGYTKVTKPIHAQCTALLWEAASELRGGEDDAEEPDGVSSEADPA